MSDKLGNAIVEVLDERASALADATDSDTVREILSDVKVEAEKRLPAFFDDRQIYRITVWFLGSVVVLSLLAQFILALNLGNGRGNPDIPQGLIALGSAAIGALAGLLAPTSGR